MKNEELNTKLIQVLENQARTEVHMNNILEKQDRQDRIDNKQFALIKENNDYIKEQNGRITKLENRADIGRIIVKNWKLIIFVVIVLVVLAPVGGEIILNLVKEVGGISLF